MVISGYADIGRSGNVPFTWVVVVVPLLPENTPEAVHEVWFFYFNHDSLDPVLRRMAAR